MRPHRFSLHFTTYLRQDVTALTNALASSSNLLGSCRSKSHDILQRTLLSLFENFGTDY